MKDEIFRVARVSDQLVSMHAYLRDRYARRAKTLDVVLIFISIWLAALSFAPSKVDQLFTPFAIDPAIWLSCLGVLIVCLAVLEHQVSWKELSASHAKAVVFYANIKQECRSLTADAPAESECSRVIQAFRMASEVCVAIPEHLFLNLKRKHRQKVLISKLLDRNPNLNIFVLKVRFALVGIIDAISAEKYEIEAE